MFWKGTVLLFRSVTLPNLSVALVLLTNRLIHHLIAKSYLALNIMIQIYN